MDTTHTTPHHEKPAISEELVPTGAVVVGMDGSAGAVLALEWAAQRAAVEGRPLALLQAVAPLAANQMALVASAGVDPYVIEQTAREEARGVLEAAVGRVTQRWPGLRISAHLSQQDAREALTRAGAHALLLVVGSRGRGAVKSLLLGSVSVAVSRMSTCPVVVVRPPHETSGKTAACSAGHPKEHAQDRLSLGGVLVGTDTTEQTLSTMDFAFREASLRSLPLAVVSCSRAAAVGAPGWSPVPDDVPEAAEQRLAVAESLAGLTEQYPDVAVQVVLARGVIERCLIDLGASADLVVVGRHGSSVLDQWGLGAVATTVVEHAAAVVAVVPTP